MSCAAAAPSEPDDDDDDDDEASRAAERLMQSVQRGFAAAKQRGVPCATRLMKEITRVCQSSSFELRLLQDSLQQWEISLFDWAFDESSPLHKDLQTLSEEKDDLVPLLLRISFPDDFPFAAPLVYCSHPTLESQYIFDGALCMEMLVDWQPTYGNVESLLVQICAFLSTSNARVKSLANRASAGPQPGLPAAAAAAVAGAGADGAAAAAGVAGGGGDGADGGADRARAAADADAAVDVGDGGSMPPSEIDDDGERQRKAQHAYANLKRFHDKKGWGSMQGQP